MNTFDERNIERIRTLAQQIRYKHDAMDWKATPQYLIKKEGLNYDEYDLNHNNFLQKYVTGPFKKLSGIIKAAFVVRENIVLIDEDLHKAKKPFGSAHELGHHGIPEHREILYVCSEHDLNQETRKEMEFEANVFASEILYPKPLMDSIHDNFPMSMDTILYLNRISGGSIHSAALKYVTSSKKECCLLTLEKSTDENDNPGLIVTKQIPSDAWVKKNGPKLIEEGQFLPKEHIVSKVAFSSDDVSKGEVSIGDTEKNFHAESFFNNYIVFALLFNDP